jgi:hypothetical protein
LVMRDDWMDDLGLPLQRTHGEGALPLGPVAVS